MALREYLLSGCAEELQIEAELARARGEAWPRARATRRRSPATPRAQARLEARGGYLWRNRATAMAHGLGLPRRGPRPAAGHVLRRAADARVAGARAGHRRGRAAARRAHQPPRHRVAGVARADARRPRRGGRAGRARPLVPGGGGHGGAGAARPAARASSPARWHQWRREQAAREIALGKAIDKQQAEIERMERFIERFRYKATKAKQAQSRVKKLAKIERIERDPARRQGPGVRVRGARSAPGG